MQSAIPSAGPAVCNSESCLRVLLVENNSADSQRLQRMVKAADTRRCDVVAADNLENAVGRLHKDPFDLVLLNLTLPDSKGLDTLTRVLRADPNVPVVVLTGMEDNRLGMRAVQAGAGDYLIKGAITPDGLLRSITYSIERHRLRSAANASSLTDELTGLYNRRGLATVSLPLFKTARRQKREMSLLVIDLVDMKRINDILGQANGDLALYETADLLRATFRESDVLARVGGDKFAVLACESDAAVAEALVARLRERLQARAGRDSGCIPIAVTIGLAQFDPQNPCDLDELLNQADSHLHLQKWHKRCAGTAEPVTS